MPERDALLTLWRHRRAAAALAAPGLVLFGAALAWFWLPGASTLAFGVSMLALLALAAASLAWIGAILTYFRGVHAGEAPTVAGSVRAAARCLPRLFLWWVLVAAALHFLARRPTFAGSWFFPPALLLPFALTLRGSRVARYLPAVLVAYFPGAWLPLQLWNWHPLFPGMAVQTASLAARFLLAWTLVCLTWLFLASLLGRLQGPATSSAAGEASAPAA